MRSNSAKITVCAALLGFMVAKISSAQHQIDAPPDQRALVIPQADALEREARHAQLTNIRLTNDAGASEQPDIAIDAAGNGYVVWQDSRDGNWEIYFCLVSPLGRKLTDDVRITGSNSASQRPKIAVDEVSQAHVVWLEGNSVYYCKLNRAGDFVVSPKKVTGGNSGAPDIAVQADGMVGITWFKQNGFFHEIGFRRVSASGSFASNEIILDSEAIFISREPYMDADDEGNFYVAYADYTGVGLFTQLIYTRIRPDNTTDCCKLVSDRDSAVNPAIELVGDNVGYFFFEDKINGNWEAVHFSGAVFTEPPGNTRALDMDADDKTETQLLLVWQDDRDGAPEIYYSSVDNGSKPIPDTRISELGANSENPSVAILPDGTGHFAWQDDRDGNWEIYFATTVTEIGKRITLLAPNGSEVLKIGATQRIKWASSDVEAVNLEYSLDGGTKWETPIAESLPNTTSHFDWLVPDTPSANCLIRVVDTGDANTFDLSDQPFVISPTVTTVIVHGFSPEIFRPPKWAWTMAQAIAQRSGAKVYTLKDGIIEYKPELSVSEGLDRVVVLDWITESDFATLGFAEGAADALAALLVKGALEGKWSLQKLHFIGHSRGALVASECIERFDAWSSDTGTLPSGLIVDREIHFTTLDAHPWDDVAGDGLADIGSAEDYRVNDLKNPTIIGGQKADGVVCWQNVKYADNYWHLGAFELLHPVDLSGLFHIRGGLYDKNLTEVAGIYSNMSHSNVHTWYHGTIDHAADEDGDDGVIDPPNSQWYPDDERVKLGYNFSQAAAGETDMIATIPPGQPLGTVPFDDDRYFNRDWIFNGDFDFGFNRLNISRRQRIPGWHFHGGGGGGFVNKSGQEMNYHLVLNPGDGSLRHNFILIPNDAEKIYFAYRVVNSSVNDELVVRLGSHEKRIPLGSVSGSYWWSFIDVTPVQGTVQTLEFEVDAGGLVQDSEVWIDEVGFRLNKGISLIVASPVTLHVYDAAGNHTGPTSDSTWVEEIPASRYLVEHDSLGHVRQHIKLPQASDGNDYVVKIIAAGKSGEFDFEIRDFTEGRRSRTASFDSVLIEPATVAVCTLRTEQPAAIATLLHIDSDGDGTFDSLKNVDSYLEAFQIMKKVEGRGSIVVSDTSLADIDTLIADFGDSLVFHMIPDSGYQIVDVLVDGSSVGMVDDYHFDFIASDHTITAIFDSRTEIEMTQETPTEFALLQNFPNPFNISTQIHYQLPAPARVNLAVYNSLGHLVAILVDDELQHAGNHKLTWHATDNRGTILPSGVYLYRLKAQYDSVQFVQTRKLLVLK